MYPIRGKRHIIRAKPCISSKTAKPVLHLITPQGVYFPLHLDQFVLSAAQTDLFGVRQAGLPLGIGVGVGKVVAVVAEAGDLQVACQHTAGERRRFEAGIDARLVERERIERTEHSDVRQDRAIVLAVAVAVGGHVHDQRDVEIRASVHDRLGVFRHATAEHLHRVAPAEADRVEIAGAEAAAAADAMVVIDRHFVFFFIINEPVVCALFLAEAAAAAGVFADGRLAVGVHLALAGAGAAAHADVFDRSAEARRFMSFEVRQRNENVRVHDRVADFCVLDEFAVPHRHFHVVGAFESVADQDRAADGQRRETVLPSAFEVFERVFAGTGVHRVAVGQVGFSAQRFDEVNDRAGVVRA